MTVFHGTKHDDIFNASSDTTSDTFDLFKGGNDTVTAGSGDDVFNLGASLNAADRLDGGTGRDVAILHGDYSAGLTLDDQTLQNIEVLRLGTGFSYNLTMADGNVASGAYMSVNASKLSAAYSLTFDASAETDGHYIVYGGKGNDTLTGGALADKFHLEQGGNDTVHGNGGDDVFVMGAAFTSGDIIDGGTGNDTLSLDGTYSTLALSDTAITNVETLKLLGNYNYISVSIAGDIAGGHTLNIDGTGATRINTFDLTAATSTGYAITAGGVFEQFVFGSNFSAATTMAGSAGGNSGITLNGTYASTVTFSDTNLNTIGNLRFNGDHSYTAAVVGNISAGNSSGGPLSVISSVTPGHSVFLDLTQGNSTAYLINNGGDGDLTVKFAGNFSASDTFANHDTGVFTIELDGDYSSGVTFGGGGATKLKLDDGFSYKLTMNAGALSTVDATALTAGHTLNFDATAAASALAITGGAGDDTVKFGSNFTASDAFNGGAGNDTLSLNGDYSGGYTFGAGQLTSVENIVMADGHSYSLATNDANVAAGATMTIDASALTGSNQLFFDGTAETDGHFAFISGAADDVIEGGKLSDTFDMSRSNGAFVSGNDGNDSFTFTTSASLLSDNVDGGAGTDTLILNGDFSASQTALTAGNLSNIEAVQLLGAANHYNLSLGTGITSASTFTIDASAAASMAMDLSGAGTKTYAVTGSSGDDTITFGTNFLATDTIDGGAGNDTLSLAGGQTLTFGATTLTGIETLALSGGAYSITTNDGNVAAGKTLTVDATALTTAQALTFNGAAEQDGNFVFEFGANFIAGDTITGGAGNDTLSFTGTQTRTLSSTAISSIETLDLNGGGTTTITGDIAGGSTLTINSVNRLSLDLTAATSSAYDISITGGTSSTITFGGNFTASDVIHDTRDSGNLFLDGDYSGGLTLSGTNISGVQEVRLEDGFSYAVSVVGQIGQSGGGFVAFRSEVNAGHSVALDLTQSTATKLDVLQEGTGDMSVKFAGNLHATDSISGGGSMTVELDGDYSSGLTFADFGGTKTLSYVNTLKLDDGFSYKLAMDEDNNGLTLTVDASALTAGHTLNFDGTNDSSGLTFKFGSNFSTADVITGGAGNDTLIIKPMTGVFTATTITNVETLQFANSGTSVNITTNDANVASGATLKVDASGIVNDGGFFIFDGSAETDGHFAFVGPGDSSGLSITGGALSDTFTLGTDLTALNYIYGEGGDDIFTYSAIGTQYFAFDGGSGNDTLSLTGGGTAHAGDFSITSVETLKLDDNTYSLTLADGDVASGATLTVDGSALTASHSLTFDGSLETDGKFAITGGAGNDTLKGGAGADTITGGMGADTLTGGGGEDVFVYTAASQSSSTTYDTVKDFAAGTDAFNLTSTVLHIASISGTVDEASFDANLQALGASHLQTATILTVTGGDLSGHTFLVVDGDGNNTYTAGQDYVIDITGYTGTITTGDFF
ncbi:MAG TPA: calcium-binding protein [Rhizomicrobium sp.]|nr:calcium-binding protein [Rhizomicrobium sp.]